MEFITEEQNSAYWEKGFLIIEQFVDPEEVDTIYEAMRKVATVDFRAMLNIDRAEDLLRQSPHSDPSHRQDVSKLTREIQLNKRMVGILTELYGREMVAVQSILIYKEQGSPFADQAWNPHQDNSYIMSPNDMYIAVGYPLSDMTPENGGLYFYPGSHKEGVLPNVPVEGANQKAGENPGNLCLEIPDKYKKEDVFLKKGDTLIFHCNLIHGSYPNYSKLSRPLLYANYVPKGEYFQPGRTSNRKAIPLR